MDEKFNSLLSIAVIPQILEIIVEKEQFNDIPAVEAFYSSKTYELLAKEETKLWHFSPLTLYFMWKSERETGEIIFPEE